ncbi:MAG: hypothetical protein KY443_08650 [Actinobacteria bacterium]|nr:hypothetical protein [Actinomycetota bacterium]
MTEERRYRLHRKLEETLGDEEATTLMEHLPPYPWDKLAMKEDVTRAVDDLREKIDARFDAFEEKTEIRFAALDEKTEIRFAALNEKMDTFVTAKEFHNTIRLHALGLMSTSVALFGIAMTLR